MATAPQETATVDLLDVHARAGQATRRFVLGIAPEKWAAPTNCSMDARALVNHIVTGHYWAAELARGRTIGDVGTRLDGDVLGTDPLAAYDLALAEAQAAFSRPGGLEQICALSYGNVPGAVYCSHRILDIFVHGWDLARATGQDDTLDPELVPIAYAMFKPRAAELAGSGAFGTPVVVPEESDVQTKLLAMFGRGQPAMTMRVLISCITGYGHLQPVLPLAAGLSRAGHEVAIATGAELRPRAAAAGFTAFAAGLGTGLAFARLAQLFPEQPYRQLKPAEIIGWYLPHLFGEILAPAMLADLEPVVRNWRPDVIVHDTWEFAGPIAAASTGIGSVSHTLGLRHNDRDLRAVAAAVAPLWRRCGLEPDPSAGLSRHLCLDITPPSLQPYSTGHDLQTIRPLRPIAPGPLPGERLPAWIEHRRNVPLVYMTLGTNTNSDTSMFRSVIDGLADLEIDVLLTIGPGHDPAALGSLPPNAHVESYVPQSLLLPACAAVICHGGAGTTLNALALGLPLLLLPQGADQYLMSDLVRSAGAARVLAPADVSPATVRSNVVALLADPAARTGPRRLQAEIAAMPGPDAAVRLIEEVYSARRGLGNLAGTHASG